MPPKIRVVPDSNVFAAALNRGYCYNWLFGAGAPQAVYDLFTSEEILREIERKLTGKFKFERTETIQFIAGLDRVLGKVRPLMAVEAVRDPKDNMILECAVEANAQLVITFDKDLLTLKSYENIQIAHPRMIKFW